MELLLFLKKLRDGIKKEGDFRLSVVQHLYTILVFVIGWVIFRAENLTYAINYLKNMFGLISEHNIMYEIPYYIDNIEMIIFVVALVCSMPIFNKILEIRFKHKFWRGVVNVWLMILFVVASSAIAASTYNPFIYFRF